MQEYSDISFYANLDPFAKKSRKNDQLRIVQRGHSFQTTSEENGASPLLDLSSFALHKKYNGPEWILDFAKWANSFPEFKKIFELKVLQVVNDGIVDIALLIAIFEYVIFECKINLGGKSLKYIDLFVQDPRNINSNLSKYLDWNLDNHFAVFQIEKFQLANFVLLKNTNSNDYFEVYDNLFLPTLKIGQKIIARIVKSQGKYLFTGGFVLVLEKGNFSRYFREINGLSSVGNGVAIKIDKSELISKSNFSIIHSFFSKEKEELNSSLYFNDYTFEDAFTELNFKLINNNVYNIIDINELEAIFTNSDTSNFELKIYKKKIASKLISLEQYIQISKLMNLCCKLHPSVVSEKKNNFRNPLFEKQIWDFIENENVLEYHWDESIDPKLVGEMINLNGDPITNYNKAVDFILANQMHSLSIEIILNAYRVIDEVENNLKNRWYLSMGIALLNIGELSLAKSYFDYANSNNIDSSKYLQLYKNNDLINYHKIVGRKFRFKEIEWGEMISQSLVDSQGILIAKSIMEYLSINSIALNKKLNFKDIAEGNRVINQILKSINISEDNSSHYKNFIQAPKIGIIFELLLSSNIVKVENGKLALSGLGKIYYYNKDLPNLTELLFVTWLKVVDWKKISRSRKTKFVTESTIHIRDSIYRVLNYMFNNGTSSFTVKELIQTIGIDYVENSANFELSRLVKSKSWINIFVKCIYEVLELFGIIQIVQMNEDITFTLTDDGIYLLGKIEGEIDRSIPLLAKKII